jgi:hypothetical protein
MSAPRPGFQYTCNLTVSNVGSLPSTNILAKLKYDNNLIFDSTSYPFLSHIGDSIIWAIDSLNLFENKSIRVYFTVPANVSLLGSSLQNIGHVLDQNIDIDTNNNSYTLQDIVIGAYDPNDKHGVPLGDGLLGEIPSNTPEIIYTIRFQNTGTAPAANAFVVDDIDPNADLSTFQFLGASHPVTYSITGAGHILFTFANINLPDSNTNEPLSHGLLRYSIYPRAGLAVGSTILNTAAIRFDFNSPVITNTTTTTIKSADVGGIISASNKSLETLVVFPNPAMDEIKVQNLGASLTLLTIYDVNGSIVLQEKLKEQAAQFLNISQLVPGVYLVSATSKSGTIQQVKLVKAAR